MSTCIWRQEKFETGRHVQHLLTNAPTTGGYPKSGTSKIALFLDILSNLAMKGPQMWPKSIMTCKYYQKCPLEKKMREFRAPGAEIWLFKKKNMDRSIDLAVQHIWEWSSQPIPGAQAGIHPSNAGKERAVKSGKYGLTTVRTLYLYYPSPPPSIQWLLTDAGRCLDLAAPPWTNAWPKYSTDSITFGPIKNFSSSIFHTHCWHHLLEVGPLPAWPWATGPPSDA